MTGISMRFEPGVDKNKTKLDYQSPYNRTGWVGTERNSRQGYKREGNTMLKLRVLQTKAKTYSYAPN